jgi:hypothetical protein
MRRRQSGDTTNQEVEMSKHVETPTSRLICFGGAKACTNAQVTSNIREDFVSLGYQA